MSSFPTPTVLWSGSNDAASPLVVLLHGRGSNETEIGSLVPHLPDGPSYAALRAPIQEGGGYAWFANRGIGRPLEDSLTETMAWCREWLDAQGDQSRDVVLVGFSGGAAFAGAAAGAAGAGCGCDALPAACRAAAWGSTSVRDGMAGRVSA